MQPISGIKQIPGVVTPLHPAVDVGTVTLKVADLKRSLAFYNASIGLQTISQVGNGAVLGAGKRPIIFLEELPGAQPQSSHTTGLYHAAILFPDRHALALKIAQLVSARITPGYADHLVSEAFYLSDPDGNGLELYRDRPRREWMWKDTQVRMASNPIDFNDFFDEVKNEDAAAASPAAPAGTKLGHVHLRVANIPEADMFYHGVLGFDITARWHGALFLSAGGYHHHIGLNTWQSQDGKPPSEPSAGLCEFSIALPDVAEYERLFSQIKLAGVPIERGPDSSLVTDPFQNRIRLIPTVPASVQGADPPA